jgi:hypothetical protein
MNQHYYNSNREQNVIGLDRFRSVNAIAPSENVSSKYVFIPTTQALTVLADHGWHPVEAKEARTRKIENQGFQKHTIRLVNTNFNRELMVGDTIPQLMLTNSHSGTSAFELAIALFRKLCANGLCVSDSTLESIRVRHMGYQDQSMSDAAESMVKALPGVLTQIEHFKNIHLEEAEKTAFAKSAIEMRFDGDTYSVQPSQVLATRRYDDRKDNSLWTTYNVVQENLIKGGVRQRRKDGTSIRSKQVKSIDADTKLNRGLWTLQTEMAKLKA